MGIYRADIIRLLRSRGRNDKASAAESQLPERVDTEEHKWVLARYGIDAKQLSAVLVPPEARTTLPGAAPSPGSKRVPAWTSQRAIVGHGRRGYR